MHALQVLSIGCVFRHCGTVSRDAHRREYRLGTFLEAHLACLIAMGQWRKFASVNSEALSASE